MHSPLPEQRDRLRRGTARVGGGGRLGGRLVRGCRLDLPGHLRRDEEPKAEATGVCEGIAGDGEDIDRARRGAADGDVGESVIGLAARLDRDTGGLELGSHARGRDPLAQPALEAAVVLVDLDGVGVKDPDAVARGVRMLVGERGPIRGRDGEDVGLTRGRAARSLALERQDAPFRCEHRNPLGAQEVGRGLGRYPVALPAVNRPIELVDLDMGLVRQGGAGGEEDQQEGKSAHGWSSEKAQRAGGRGQGAFYSTGSLGPPRARRRVAMGGRCHDLLSHHRDRPSSPP